MEAGTAEGEQAIRRLAEALEMKGAILKSTSRPGTVVTSGTDQIASGSRPVVSRSRACCSECLPKASTPEA